LCQTADEASHDTEHIGPDRRKQSRDFCFGNDIEVGPNPAGLMRSFSPAKPISRISNIYHE